MGLNMGIHITYLPQLTLILALWARQITTFASPCLGLGKVFKILSHRQDPNCDTNLKIFDTNENWKICILLRDHSALYKMLSPTLLCKKIRIYRFDGSVYSLVFFFCFFLYTCFKLGVNHLINF